jgi:hypothetical protein
MQNPFKKRATEFIEDPATFVSLTSPEPLKLFFDGDSTALFDRLVTVVGTPGSGKTTLARLIDIETLLTLVRSTAQDSKSLTSALASYQIIKDLRPQVLSYRLPSSSNLRDIWELPYSENLRSVLLKSFIQAKAILGWLRKLERLEVQISEIQIITKDGYETQRNLINANNPVEFRKHARSIEEEVLRIITSLLPPSEEKLLHSGIKVWLDVFESIESFIVPNISGLEGTDLNLKPMLIIDDAHELHPVQFLDLTTWLKSREMKIARWLMTRVDAIAHDDFRKALVEADSHSGPGTTLGRDHIFKLMQRERKDRKTFRRIARDISRQYIEQMPSFRRKGISTLSDCLSDQPQQLNKTDLGKLRDAVDQLITDMRSPSHQLEKIRDSLPSKLQADQFLAAYRILLNREKKRTPQKDLFGISSDISEDTEFIQSSEVEDESDEENKTVKSALVRGAEIQLMHEFDRPFFFTFDRLADASGDNIEQFINLAGALVDGLETKLLRGNPARLDAKEQHQLLTMRATQTINEWDFPNSESVRKLIFFIAHKCINKTLEPNAPLNDGANAFGIPQKEMNSLQENAPALVSVLHFALAYNAITLQENYECKNRTWCLFELGGLPNLVYRLTLNRGGFCEGHLSDLLESIS